MNYPVPPGYPHQPYPTPGAAPAATYPAPAPQPYGPGGYGPPPGPPQQGGYPPAPMAPYGGPQAPHMPAPTPQQPQQPRPFYAANPQHVLDASKRAAEAAERAAKARSGAGGEMKFWTPVGPTGQEKWGPDVPVGFRGGAKVWICPSWAPHGRISVEEVTHFWRGPSGQNGTSVSCGGEGRCPICLAYGKLFRAPGGREAAKQRYGKRRFQTIFQILLLDYPQAHQSASGQMRPLLFRASSALGGQINQVGISRAGPDGLPFDITNPARGVPLYVQKLKKGVDKMDVEWSVMPLDASTLPHHLYPALGALHDLDKLVEPLTYEDARRALTEMALDQGPDVVALVEALPRSTASSAGVPQQGVPPQQQPPGYGPPAGYPQQQPPPGYGPPAQGYPPPAPQQPGYGPQTHVTQLHGQIRGQ